jgi:adenine nucleotide transporter 17
MSESIASEVISAMVGGIFSASALYPLEVLKTRMQAETKVASSSSSSDEKEKKTTMEEEESSSEEDVSPPNPSSSSNKEVMKRKYAIAASRGMKSYATLMYENEGGIAPFYSGVLTSAIQSATEKALYFFAYTFYKNG